MKVAELLSARQQNWRQLDQLCVEFQDRSKRRLGAEKVTRFAALYRAACADLALADAYQLPPKTVFYLHDLVGRAHNQLYRSRMFKLRQWGQSMFVEVPQRLFRDRYLRVAFALFWGLFLASMYLCSQSPKAARLMLSEETMRQSDEMFAQPLNRRDSNMSGAMLGFYIQHNTTIGLECFAFGILLGVGGLFATAFNAALLGAVFGYMTTSPSKVNFFQFVTAHGPFELTAIVLSAAAGMRLGFSLIDTRGLSRSASLAKAGPEAMPIMGVAMALFAMAGLIEGFLSPSAAPYWIKALVAAVSSCVLIFYFVGLGYPRSVG